METQLLARNRADLEEWLLKDALSLLPDGLRDQVQSEPGAVHPESVIKKIYDGMETVAIPVMVYYDGFVNVEDFDNAAAEGKKKFGHYENRHRDLYNLAINLMMNSWLTHLQKSSIRIREMPMEGIYVRDLKGDLHYQQQ